MRDTITYCLNYHQFPTSLSRLQSSSVRHRRRCVAGKSGNKTQGTRKIDEPPPIRGAQVHVNRVSTKARAPRIDRERKREREAWRDEERCRAPDRSGACDYASGFKRWSSGDPLCNQFGCNWFKKLLCPGYTDKSQSKVF